MKMLKFLSALLLAGSIAQAQELPKLQIGDPAPAFTYEKWIQGPQPITELKSDRLYVLEFWATWCGPCIAAMPHLSELAKHYDGKIDFIGCDVWENKYGGPKEQTAYADKVTNFVKDQYKMGRLTYNVVMDNNEEFMGQNWLKAAGQEGIPCSFVIDKGKIAWIGHPIGLDSILSAIVDGRYDYRVEKEKGLQRAKREAAYSAGPDAAIKAYKDAEAKKDYAKALKLIDAAVAKYPEQSYRFVTDKFMILQDHYSVEKALIYGRALQKEKLPGQILIANLYTTDKLPKAVAEFGIEAIKQYDDGKNLKVYEIMAAFQAKAGYYTQAAQTLRKAAEIGASLKDDPSFTPAVMEEYRHKAEEYDKLAKQTNSIK